jgi:hypothetical protein
MIYIPIQLITLLHFFITIFTFFGILLPNKYIKYYILFIIILQIHWLTNNNECIITQIEQKYATDMNIIHEQMKSDTKYPFMEKIFNKINVSFDDSQYDILYNITIPLLFIYALYKHRQFIKNNYNPMESF